MCRKMDEPRKIGIVWTVLKAKVDEIGLGIGATQALEKWRSDVMRMPQFAGRILNVRLLDAQRLTSLLRELSNMTLSDLCHCPILPDGVVQRTENLLKELRTIALVADKVTIAVPTALDHD